MPPTREFFLLDTSHFFRKLSEVKIPDGAFLVTFDVSSLYTSISHDDTVRALVESYGTHNPDAYPSKIVIEVLTRLVLKLNGFVFNNLYYLQISGTATGTRMVPNYLTYSCTI
uniref:Tick transposon n=1 Tax=Rhipicephalus microplus TaxID=6941 RepID=A0A6G5AEP7_RHIMP